jgi:hypothetical protein
VGRDARVKVFVKYEKFNYSSKPDTVPRVISPRSPRFNVEFGRFIRPIEERIFDAIGEVYGMPTVMKGLNAAACGKLIYRKWASFKDPVAVGLDAERFDQHVSQAALGYEHNIYAWCFWRQCDRDRLADLCRVQYENKCSGHVADGWLAYDTDGCRMSGDMNTSLGNCLLMCAMVYSYAAMVGVPIHLANNGDDCVVFMERSNLSRFSSRLKDWFIKMGFSMAVEEPVYDIEKISFCQTQPIFVGPGVCDYIMVRDPRIAIAKDALSITPLRSVGEKRGWLGAVGTGGLSLTGGIPIWQSFYQMYVRSSTGRKSNVETGWGWGVRMLAKGMTRPVMEPTPATRCSFWVAFGITPKHQIAIEREYGKQSVSMQVTHCAPQPRRFLLW